MRRADAAGLIAFACMAMLPPLASGACPPPQFTDPANVRLNGPEVMIVTHATAAHDSRYATKRGVDEAIAFAKSQRIPVVYLHDDDAHPLYFMNDCNPAYWVKSEGGEVKFDVRASHVYLVGGHLELCLSTTVHDILYAWSEQPKRNLTLTYFMDGIYSNGRGVEDTDPYAADFRRFMGIVTWGRPAGEHWPKLSMLEMMGVIQREENEEAFLRRILPHYARTMPDGYRVAMQLNDLPERILQRAPGFNPPTLRFQFVDSAITYGQ